MESNLFDVNSIVRIKRDLNHLIRSDAENISDVEMSNIMGRVNELATGGDVDRAVMDLLLSLIDYPMARQYVIAETRADREEIKSLILSGVNIEKDAIETFANLTMLFTDLDEGGSANRNAILNPATLGGYTVKFSNIKISPAKLLKIVGIMVPGTLGLTNPKEPLLFIGSLLALIISVTLEVAEGLKIDLDDDLTSVFLGCIAAEDNSHKGKKGNKESSGLESEDITKMANKYRSQVGISRLNEKEVVRNLYLLEKLRCIKHLANDEWQVVEKVQVKK